MSIPPTGDAGAPDPSPASTQAPVPALVVMHADLGGAMLRAAERIYGPVEGLEVISNEGLSRDALQREIARRVDAWPHGGVILTDFWGGSCHLCGASAARGHAVAVVTGCNLSMLLDYLHNRQSLDAEALGRRLIEKGRQSIRLQPGRPE